MFNSTKPQAHRVDTTDDNLGDEGFVGFIQNNTVVSRSKVADLKSKPLKINPALMPCDVLNGEVDESKSIAQSIPTITMTSAPQMMSDAEYEAIHKIVAQHASAVTTRTHLSPTAPWPDFTDTMPSVPGELHIPRRTGSRRPDPRAKWARRFTGLLGIAFLITLIAIGFAVIPHQ